MTMKKLYAFVLGFFMACAFVAPAHASFPATLDPSTCTTAPCYNYTMNVWGTIVRSSHSAVCEATATAGTTADAFYNWQCVSSIPSQGTFHTTRKSDGSFFNSQSHVITQTSVPPSPPVYTCPSNSTLDGTNCTCNAGYDQSGSSCVAHVNPCTAKAGQTTIVNITTGWKRTADPGDSKFVGTKLEVFPDTASDGQCTVEVGNVQKCYHAQSPSTQGLYRISCDFVARVTGTEASHGAGDPANPAAPNQNCPGYVGEVNGVTGCYGTASAPVTTQTGSTPLPVEPGNPSAGEKPATGEGSGSTGATRTPSTGSGGNSGGPASAATGAGSTGSTAGSVKSPVEGEVQAECGAPGQPKCAIDETGTPSGAGTTFNGANTALDTTKDAISTAISGAQGIATPSWSFSFALPTGCTPFAVEMPFVNFTMNPCLAQGMIHDLMSMIWAAVTAFTIISMVGRTIRES